MLLPRQADQVILHEVEQETDTNETEKRGYFTGFGKKIKLTLQHIILLWVFCATSIKQILKDQYSFPLD